jgi:hypothetical protein
MKELIEQLKQARKVATPLVVVGTYDPEVTLTTLRTLLNGKSPLLTWDCVDGVRERNELGQAAMSAVNPEQCFKPTGMLVQARELPAKTVLAMVHPHRFFDDPTVVEAIRQLRDPFATNTRMLVLLCPEASVPQELRQSVVTLNERLPTKEQLSSVAQVVYNDLREKNPATPAPTEQDLTAAAQAMQGFGKFMASQVGYLGINFDTARVDIEAMWGVKRSLIAQVPGLSAVEPGLTFADIGGCGAAKEYMLRRAAGKRRPALIVMIDEIEKQMAGSGSGGDSSGVSTYIKGAILQAWQDYEWDGMLEPGPPGCSKSHFIKCCAAELKVPVFKMDLGATKGQYVGVSEQNINEALRTLHAIGGKDVFFMATCNDMQVVTADLRRRFRSGVWYFPLPGGDELDAIWGIHLTKRGLPLDMPRPDDTNYTGSDVETVCERAWELEIDLKEAAEKYLTPVFKTNRESILALEKLAAGRFLDANTGGLYNPSAGSRRQVRRVSSGRGLGAVANG